MRRELICTGNFPSTRTAAQLRQRADETHLVAAAAGVDGLREKEARRLVGGVRLQGLVELVAELTFGPAAPLRDAGSLC